MQTLVLRWRSGTAPPSSISPISATPLASLARGLCSNFNLKDAHAPLSPPARSTTRQPDVLANHPISSSLPFEENGRSSRPDLHPGFTSERKTRRTLLGSHPLRERRTRSLGICRPLFDVRCAALFSSCCFCSRTRRVSLPSLQRGNPSADAACGK